MKIVRPVSAIAVTLLLAMVAVRSAVVTVLAKSDPSVAARVWPGHPDVELALGMTEIGAAAHRGQSVGLDVFQKISAGAAKEPLSPDPYLVRGVQAQLAGRMEQAERAFEAAEWRDPRSLPAHYFLADTYLRSGDIRRGLLEYAALARLAPDGISSASPYVASYARDPSRWPQLRSLLHEQPDLQGPTLDALAADPANAAAILALADQSHRNASSSWLPTLLASLVAHGDYAKARAIWIEIARVPVQPNQLLFDAQFANPVPPPPFNWALTSSTVGLAERQAGGRLHVIYYGQEDGVLASQLVVLPPGVYRLATNVGGGGAQARSLRWSLTCANGAAPFATVGLDSLSHQPWTFVVPPNCGAQRLELVGSSSDIPQQVEVTLSHVSLTRGVRQ